MPTLFYLEGYPIYWGDGIWREAFEHIRWNWKLYELFFI
jgi:hypothetical protein